MFAGTVLLYCDNRFDSASRLFLLEEMVVARRRSVLVQYH